MALSSTWMATVVALGVVSACSHDWDRFTPVGGTADAGPSTPDAGADGGAVGTDAGVDADAGAGDDAGMPPPDAGQPDAGVPPCGVGVDGQTVAYWDFESIVLPSVDDVIGRHDGVVGSGTGMLVPGAQACSTGLRFPNRPNTHVVVADSPDWDLTTGAIELWFRVDAASITAGNKILGRDASGSARGGHMVLAVATDQTLYARFQTTASGSGGTFLCADTLIEPDVWYHVGINFAPSGAEIFLNGLPGTRSDRFMNTDDNPRCGGPHTIGLDDNDNPWVFGADPSGSPEGSSLTPLRGFFHGDIDDIRVSSVTRDFASYFP